MATRQKRTPVTVRSLRKSSRRASRSQDEAGDVGEDLEEGTDVQLTELNESGFQIVGDTGVNREDPFARILRERLACSAVGLSY